MTHVVDSLDDAVSVRRLRERDESRDRGDLLARAVEGYLEGRAGRLGLWAAVTAYRRHELGDRPPVPDERLSSEFLRARSLQRGDAKKSKRRRRA